MWVAVCRSDELAPGQVRGTSAGRREIVVARAAEGTVVALASKCPHRGAPLRFGRLDTLVVSDRFGEYESGDRAVLRCPWHAFEYSVTDGCAVADPRFRLQTYAVKEEDGEILVDI